MWLCSQSEKVHCRLFKSIYFFHWNKEREKRQLNQELAGYDKSSAQSWETNSFVTFNKFKDKTKEADGRLRHIDPRAGLAC